MYLITCSWVNTVAGETGLNEGCDIRMLQQETVPRTILPQQLKMSCNISFSFIFFKNKLNVEYCSQ